MKTAYNRKTNLIFHWYLIKRHIMQIFITFKEYNALLWWINVLQLWHTVDVAKIVLTIQHFKSHLLDLKIRIINILIIINKLESDLPNNLMHCSKNLFTPLQIYVLNVTMIILKKQINLIAFFVNTDQWNKCFLVSGIELICVALISEPYYSQEQK